MKTLNEKELLNINGGKVLVNKVSSTTSNSLKVSTSNKSRICKGSGDSSRCRKG